MQELKDKKLKVVCQEKEREKGTGKSKQGVTFMMEKCLDKLSYQQARHITVLEALVEMATIEQRKYKDGDSDGACGVGDAMNTMAEMIEVDRCYSYESPTGGKVNEHLFDEVKSDNEDQKIVYQSAIGTSKWKLKRILEAKLT